MYTFLGRKLTDTQDPAPQPRPSFIAGSQHTEDRQSMPNMLRTQLRLS